MLFMSRSYGTNPYKGPLEIPQNFSFPPCHQTLQKGLISNFSGFQYEFLAKPSFPRRAANLPEQTCGFSSSCFSFFPLQSDTIESSDSISLEGMGVSFCRPYALVGFPFSSSNRLDVLLSSDENTFDSSHTTAFSERLCCSSDFASWINQSLSFSHPSLEESQIHQSQVGGQVLAVTAFYSAGHHRSLSLLNVKVFWDSLFHLLLPCYPVIQDNRVAFFD